MLSHEDYMQEAIHEAAKAAAIGEVPIGAVAVCNGEVVARAHNLRGINRDPLGHAELLVLRQLGEKFQNWRFDDVTFYATCEPCIMCMGALIQARIPHVVFGCREPKMGAAGSLYNFSTDERLHHKIEVTPHVLSEECAQVLKNFFKDLRKGVEVEVEI